MKTEKYQIRWFYSGTGRDHRVTTCRLNFNGESALASSICNPKDNFNKDAGRKLSLARAMNELRLEKNDRKLVWDDYRSMTKKGRW
jgi:hypothetical protein